MRRKESFFPGNKIEQKRVPHEIFASSFVTQGKLWWIKSKISFIMKKAKVNLCFKINQSKKHYRTVVVERSNALVYLMISVCVLELKVEGSNPGHPEIFFCFGMPR